jgi:hypothetical protein
MERERDNTRFELLWRSANGRQHRELFRSFRRAERKQRALQYHSAAREITLRVFTPLPVRKEAGDPRTAKAEPIIVRISIGRLMLGRWPVRAIGAAA